MTSRTINNDETRRENVAEFKHYNTGFHLAFFFGYGSRWISFIELNFESLNQGQWKQWKAISAASTC